MDYYRVLDDLNYPNRWFLKSLNIVDEGIVSVSDFFKTSKIQINENIEILANLRSFGKNLDFNFADFEIIIVSEKIVSLFKSSENQIFNIKIQDKNTDNKFYLVNVLNSLQCLNEDLSDFAKFKKDDPIRPDKAGEYKFINKIVLYKSMINPEIDIFRLKGFEVALIVSENFKNKFEKQNCIGVKFQKVT